MYIKIHEEAVVLDADGKKIFSKVGGQSSVSFTDDDMALFKDAQFTHNHPSGNSFSIDDIMTAAKADMAVMRAVGTNRLGETFVHVMRRPKEGWAAKREAIIQSFTRNSADVSAELWGEIQSGALSRERASASHYHEVWSRVSAEVGVDYLRSKDLGTYHEDSPVALADLVQEVRRLADRHEMPTVVNVTLAPPGKTVKRVERDAQGQIIRVVEEPEEDP